ncbi:MAG: DUF1295 domain-containing protein [Pseudomonadota bacterium]
MSELPFVLITTASVVLACVFVLWVISVAIKNASIIDIFWGPGFAIIAWVAWAFSDGDELRKFVLAGLTSLWAARLGIYLAIRNLGHGEDPRYQAMRRRAEKNGKNFGLRSLLSIFVLQAVLMWFISLPIQIGQMYQTPPAFGWVAIIGIILFAIGFLFEALGDWQLRVFKANPNNNGKVMDTGLWRYTRHPNYFGNACLWWGLYLIASENMAGALTIASPVFMTFLLLKVSGVSLLEKSLTQTKPQYADYVQKTNAFFPGPPKAN